jgi:hypothetical protein
MNDTPDDRVITRNKLKAEISEYDDLNGNQRDQLLAVLMKCSVILSVLDPRKCECLKDYSLDFEHAYMTTYLAS